MNRDRKRELCADIMDEGLGIKDAITSKDAVPVKARLCEKYNIKLRALNYHIAGVRAGGNECLTRKLRPDAGQRTSCAPDVLAWLEEVVLGTLKRSKRRDLKRKRDEKVTHIYEALRVRFADLDGLPSYRTILRVVRDIEARYEGERQGIRIPAYVPEMANDLWEIDISRSDFFVFEPGGDRPVRLALWAIIDVATRCIVWAEYRREEDTDAYLSVLLRAILPKTDRPEWLAHGTPKVLRLDRGKVFVGERGTRCLSALRITPEKARPHTPTDKPFIERWFGTAHGWEQQYPGHCGHDNAGPDSIDPVVVFKHDGTRWYDPRPGADGTRNRPLLTTAEANENLHRWITARYHEDAHSGLPGNVCPAAMWQALVNRDPSCTRHPFPEQLEHVLLWDEAECTVRRSEVRFECQTFRADCLKPFQEKGKRVLVRFNRQDIRTAVAYTLEGARIGELANVNAFIRADAATLAEQKKLASEKRRADKRSRKALTSLNPHQARELLPEVQQAAAQAVPRIGMAGGTYDISPAAVHPSSESVPCVQQTSVPPEYQGLTVEEARGLIHTEVFGMPVFDGPAEWLPEEVRPEYEELREARDREWTTQFRGMAVGDDRSDDDGHSYAFGGAR